MERDNGELELGTELYISVAEMSNSETKYTIEQLIDALNATTSLQTLKIDFNDYEPTPERNRRWIEPLCQCLAHLPVPSLRLVFFHVNLWKTRALKALLEQFLMAAKQCRVRQLALLGMRCIPIDVLVNFCHSNRHLKVLELVNLTLFSSENRVAEDGGRRPAADILMLDKLILDRVQFSSGAADTFGSLVPRWTVSALELDEITAYFPDDTTITTALIVSKLMKPSVQHLTLGKNCQSYHSLVALEKGAASLIDLDITIAGDNDHVELKLDLLSGMVQNSVQLNGIAIHMVNGRNIRLPLSLFRAMDACATVTRFHVSDADNDDFCRPHCGVEQLQQIAQRNRELARFVATPSTYHPIYRLPELMLQFQNCPTGRYMLVRCLPGVLSFDNISRKTELSTNEPERKKRRNKSPTCFALPRSKRNLQFSSCISEMIH